MQHNNWISPNISAYLNFMRVTAAEFVLIGHLFYWNDVHRGIIAFANYGVVIFFILSGMLISNSVFVKKYKGNYGFIGYFIDRLARIYSGLIPSLLFILILDTVHLHFFPENYLKYASIFPEFAPIHDFTFQNFIDCLLMLQHFAIASMSIGFGFGTCRSLWSLAAEWWLYMLFEWLILSKKGNMISLLILIFFLVFPVAYLFSGLSHIIYAWFLGVAITLIMSSDYIGKVKKLKTPFLYIGIISFLYMFSILNKVHYNYDNIYIVVLTACALFFIVNGLEAISFGEKFKHAIGFMADYSFTLYLIHATILAFASAFKIISNNFGVYFIVIFVLSNVIAGLIAYYTEMRHKDLAKFLHQRYLTYKTTHSTEAPI